MLGQIVKQELENGNENAVETALQNTEVQQKITASFNRVYTRTKKTLNSDTLQMSKDGELSSFTDYANHCIHMLSFAGVDVTDLNDKLQEIQNLYNSQA